MTVRNFSLVAATFFLILHSVQAAVPDPACASDRFFAQEGWVLHEAAEFDTLALALAREIEAHAGEIVADVSEKFYSEDNELLMRMVSQDDLRSDRDLMYGDYVWIYEEGTRRLVEFRWFDGTRKHLARRGTACAAELIPYAINSLF